MGESIANNINKGAPMEFLQNTIINHENIYHIWNVLGLWVGLFMSVFPGKFKKVVTIYICCYAGLIFGSLAGFRMFYNSTAFISFACVGICALLVLSCVTSWGADFVITWVVVAKMLLIFCATLSDEMSGFTLWTCVFGGLFGGVASVGVGSGLKEEQRHMMWAILCGVFGVCETAGNFVSLYRFPLGYNLKFMMQKNEYCNYFSTWMNCDFNIVGNQDPFLVLLVLGFIVESVILCMYLIRKRK